MPPPIATSIMPRNKAKTHSIFSCPYGCPLSAGRLEMRIPTSTMSVLTISDKECTASDIKLTEWMHIPMIPLNKNSPRLIAIPTAETLIADCASWCSIYVIISLNG